MGELCKILPEHPAFPPATIPASLQDNPLTDSEGFLMLPSTAEVAFGGVIIYQRQRQLSLIRLLNTCIATDKKFPVLFVKPAGSGASRAHGRFWRVVVVPVSAHQPSSFWGGLMQTQRWWDVGCWVWGSPSRIPLWKGDEKGEGWLMFVGKNKWGCSEPTKKNTTKIKKWNKMKKKVQWSERGENGFFNFISHLRDE